MDKLDKEMSTPAETPRTKKDFYDVCVKEFKLNTDDAFTNIFAHCCAWQDRCDGLKDELTALRAAHEAAQATIELLRKENGMQHTKLVAAQAKLATLIEAHNNLRADYTKLCNECDRLRTKPEARHHRTVLDDSL